MATKADNKKLENLVEQKIFEFLGDPDSELEIKKGVIAKLRKNTRQKNRRLISHADVLRRYGLR